MHLQHCKQIDVPGISGPCSVTVTSAGGPGQVEVFGSSGALHGTVQVPGSGSAAVPDPGKICVHYHKDPGAPDEIDVDVTSP